MLIYLAARYNRREELCTYRAALEALGHTVTSRWLNGGHDGSTPRATRQECQQYAQEDKADLYAAQLVIAFTEGPHCPASRGGRHVEAGLALAWDKQLVIVGPEENVFYTLAEVQRFADWWELGKCFLPSLGRSLYERTN